MTLQVGHSTSQRQRTQSWTVSVWTSHKASQPNSWTTRPSIEPFMASKAEQLSTCGPMWQPSPSWPSLSAGASAHNHFAAWLASSVHLSIVFWYSKKTTHTVLFNQRLALLNCSGILWRPPTLLSHFATLPLLGSPHEVCGPYKSTRSRFFVAAIKSFVLPNLSLSWSRAKMTGCC